MDRLIDTYRDKKKRYNEEEKYLHTIIFHDKLHVMEKRHQEGNRERKEKTPKEIPSKTEDSHTHQEEEDDAAPAGRPATKRKKTRKLICSGNVPSQRYHGRPISVPAALPKKEEPGGGGGGEGA